MNLVANLFTKTNEYRLLKYFQEQREEDIVVCDEHFAPFFARHFAGTSAARFMAVQEFLGSPVTDAKVVVCVLGREKASIVAGIRDHCCRSGAVCLELVQDILYPLSFGFKNPEHGDYMDGNIDAPAHRFAVICSGRSGSTYLCDLLASSGMGIPFEHVRPPVVFLARHAGAFGFDPLDWYRLLERRCKANDCFGTKFIGSFMDNFLQALPVESRESMLRTLGGYKFVHLVRRSKIEQAVSQFIAANVRVWHLRDNEMRKQARYLEARSALQYSFEGIWQKYKAIVKDELWIVDFLSAMKADTIRIDYEALVADPRTTVERIAEHLAVTRGSQGIVARSSLVKTADSKNAEFTELFRADARSRMNEVYADSAHWLFEEILSPSQSEQ